MKTIGKFNNSFSANICKVPAFVLNENLIWTAGVANTDLIPIEVVVDDEYYDKALEILKSQPEKPDSGQA